VEILAQSSTAFVLTHNFQGTHILGASRGYLSDSVASCFYVVHSKQVIVLVASKIYKMTDWTHLRQQRKRLKDLVQSDLFAQDRRSVCRWRCCQSKLGRDCLIFINHRVKVTGTYYSYSDLLLSHQLLSAIRQIAGKFIFHAQEASIEES